MLYMYINMCTTQWSRKDFDRNCAAGHMRRILVNERVMEGVTEEVNQRDAFSYKNVLHTHTFSVLNAS